MATTDLLIGSYPNLEAQTLSVTTAGPVTEPLVLAAGSYYLYDDITPFDLLDVLQNVLESHSVLNDVSFSLQQNLRIRIDSSIAFSMVWPSDGILRDLLGWTGSLASNTVHTAPNISPLLWSAGKPATWEARLGTDGIPVRDIAVGQSGPGTVRATSFNRYRRNTMTFRYVQNSRVWTTAEAGGEFFTFFDQVLAERRRFKVWRNYPEDLTSSVAAAPADTGAPIPSSGAYIYSGGSEMPWGREFNFVDSLHPITIPVVSTREFDAA